MRNAKRIAARVATKKGVVHGRYVDLELEARVGGNLEMVLTEDGRQEIDELRKLPEEEAMSTVCIPSTFRRRQVVTSEINELSSRAERLGNGLPDPAVPVGGGDGVRDSGHF